MTNSTRADDIFEGTATIDWEQSNKNFIQLFLQI